LPKFANIAYRFHIMPNKISKQCWSICCDQKQAMSDRSTPSGYIWASNFFNCIFIEYFYGWLFWWQRRLIRSHPPLFYAL